ncbi:MAG: PIG-L family deacetylase [Chloroflexota bacterium]
MSANKRLKILGVFAHPDDEVFCAGGTFARYAAEGADVMVVSATTGDAGQIRDARIATRRTLGTVRARELQASCGKLGVQHCLCLDYGDGTLREMDINILIEHVTQIIRDFQPDVVITFGEDGAYGHPDHIAISIAATQACRLAGMPDQFAHQLADGLNPHAPARLYHSHFPRSRMLMADRLAQWLTEIQNNFAGSPDFARALLLFAEETTLLNYSSDHIAVNWYPAGFFIIEQGEIAKHLYLILSGRAQAVVEDADGTQEVVNEMGPGQFFGERALASGERRMAHVVAAENTTCLAFSSESPLAFLGRGAEARITGDESASMDDMNAHNNPVTTCIDVSDYVEQKVAAMAAHRTQYPITPDMFPMSMLRDMLGREHFVRVLPPRETETTLI